MTNSLLVIKRGQEEQNENTGRFMASVLIPGYLGEFFGQLGATFLYSGDVSYYSWMGTWSGISIQQIFIVCARYNGSNINHKAAYKFEQTNLLQFP